jgi:branched-chain amino acid transport system ATP-binding protein
VLELQDVHSYYGQSHIIQGVSLSVSRGETVALVGRNGAGKTTLLKSIMGILPARQGRVLFDGRDITRLPAHEIARHGITLVPEDRRIFPRLTVAENLRVAARARGAHDGADQLEPVFAYFPRLRERLRQSGQSLSGGEQQMLALARGFLARPDLMLIDELSGGLMPMLVEALMGILRRINGDGITILLVEQDLEVALALARRCYVLDQGRIQFEGTAEALRESQDVQRRYLGVT